MIGSSLYPRFTDAEHRRRQNAVERLMKEQDLAALVVYGAAGFPGPLHYLSEYPPRSPTWLVASPAAAPTLFLHFVNHVPAARDISTVDDVRCYWPSVVGTVAVEVRERIGTRARVGVVGGRAVPHGQWVALTSALPDVEFTDITSDVQRIRWVRSDEEIERFRRSGELIDRACDELVGQLSPGMTELEIQAALQASFVPGGGSAGIMFISSTDMDAPDRRSPWQLPSHREVRVGSVVITELAVNYHGYSTQVHRPFSVGATPSALYQELFDVARACFDRVRVVLRDGATTEDVQEAADVVEEAGFSLFDSIVHGESGKNPELGAAGSPHAFEPWEFREGQVMVIQPNVVTEDGRAGLQAGCTVRVGREGSSPLHGYPLVFPTCGSAV